MSLIGECRGCDAPLYQCLPDKRCCGACTHQFAYPESSCESCRALPVDECGAPTPRARQDCPRQPHRVHVDDLSICTHEQAPQPAGTDLAMCQANRTTAGVSKFALPLIERALQPFPRYEVDALRLPVGGCQYQIRMPQNRLIIAATALLVCDHEHNFVVAQDPPAIYCSKSALGCLHDAYADF